MHIERIKAWASCAPHRLSHHFRCDRLVLLVIISFGASLTLADPGAKKALFDIEAQPARTALTLYARQARVQLGFAPGVVDNILTNAVKGEYDKVEALDLLLRGTGLEGEYGESGIIIRRIQSPTVTSGITNGAATANDSADGLQFTQATAQPVPRRSMSKGDDDTERSKNQLQRLEEVVVTGSRIRGAQSVSPLVTIERDEIDHSGYATVTEVLKSLPQNFAGGQSEDTGVAEPGNISVGSTVNLRGLGPGSTLLLVNGRRQAQSGRFGGFVDLSSIPLTAIERIEVLTDGASAIYGADAVGGVVNVILRSDFEGAETRVRLSPDAGNDRDAYQFGHVYGRTWSTGNLLAAYEFNRRDALANRDRPYLASSDLTPFGGDDFRDTRSQPGNILNTTTGERFAIPMNQDGRSLEANDLITTTPNLENQLALGNAMPEQEQHSVFLTLNQTITERFGVLAEVRYRKRSFETASNPPRSTLRVPRSNAFIDDALLGAVNGVPASERPFLFVEYSFADDFGPFIAKGDAASLEGVLRGNVSIGSTWEIEMFIASSNEEIDSRDSNFLNPSALNAALADSNPATAFNPFGDGSNTNPETIDLIRAFQVETQNADLSTINVTANGSLMSLPGGDLRLAVGADYREDSIVFHVQHPALGVDSETRFRRNVTATFAELFIPVVGFDNSIPFARHLDLSIAARYEEYSDFGTTTNPKVGLSWSPLETVTVRSTFGTSFRAPALENLRPVDQAVILDLDDPDSPTGQTRTLVRAGNNPDLTEETADSWTFGLDIRPSFLQQLELSLNYFEIEYEDRITRPDSFRDVHQEQYRAIVNSDPTQAELDAICLSPTFFGDPASCTVDLVEAIADGRRSNVAVTNVEGVDFSASYEWDTRLGDWTFRVDGTQFTEYSEAFSASAPEFEIKDTIGNPIGFRARAGASWSDHNLRSSMFINFSDSYVDDVSVPKRKIDAHTTVDLQLAYESGPGRDYFSNWVFALSILNLFNEDPPFANTPRGGYDRANADPMGRQVALQVRKTW